MIIEILITSIDLYELLIKLRKTEYVGILRLQITVLFYGNIYFVLSTRLIILYLKVPNLKFRKTMFDKGIFHEVLNNPT